jgi:hypothetical protein
LEVIGAGHRGNQNGINESRTGCQMAMVKQLRRQTFFHRSAIGPASIALGIANLSAAACWPGLPVVTAMALVALGATLTMTLHWGQISRLRPLVAIHAAVYANLYLIFVGAVCHAALAGPNRGLSLPQSIDLLASVAPMAVAARLVMVTLSGNGDAPGR